MHCGIINFPTIRIIFMKTLRSVKKIINGFRNYEREDGLICGVEDKWNLVDWPANLRDGYDFKLEPPKEKRAFLRGIYVLLCVKGTV